MKSPKQIAGSVLLATSLALALYIAISTMGEQGVKTSLQKGDNPDVRSDSAGSSSGSPRPARDSKNRSARENAKSTIADVDAFKAQVSDISWNERGDMFEKAIKAKTISMMDLWSVFSALEANSPDKYGAGGVSYRLFRGFAKQDPLNGIKCFSSLDPGFVRQQALKGISCNVPSGHVAELNQALIENGYPEEIEEFKSYLWSAIDGYDSNEIKKLISARLFDDKYQTRLKAELVTRLKIEAEQSGKNESAPQSSNFSNDYVNDRVRAAFRLQNGVYGEDAQSDARISEVATDLTFDQPSEALDWALRWDKKERALLATEAVGKTWMAMDPIGYSAHVSRMSDVHNRELSSIGIIRHLLEKKSFKEAEDWFNSLRDPQALERVRTIYKESNVKLPGS